MVGQKHTSKYYEPRLAASLEFWRTRLKRLSRSFFRDRFQSNQNHLIPANRAYPHFVGWFRFFLCLNELIDPLVQILSLLQKPLFLLLDKRVVRSAITLVGLRNCGNCPDDQCLYPSVHVRKSLKDKRKRKK
jgi:hypothetical protein